MTRSRAFTRSQRWTAKLRRRHLRDALPPSAQAGAICPKPGPEQRSSVRRREQLQELLKFAFDPGSLAEI